MKVKQSKKIGLGKHLPTKDNLLQDAANKEKEDKSRNNKFGLGTRNFQPRTNLKQDAAH